MRVRHVMVMGLTGLLVAAWCPPAVEDAPAARYGPDHLSAWDRARNSA